MNAKRIAILVGCLLLLVILLQNTQVISFRVLFWKITLSQVLLVIAALALGFLGGFLAAKLPRRRGRAKPEPSPHEEVEQ